MKRPTLECRRIWFVEFLTTDPAGYPHLASGVFAYDLSSGREHILSKAQYHASDGPPYPSGSGLLIVFWDANRALACLLALGWPLPRYILDLAVEFRCLLNGTSPRWGWHLDGALLWFGLNDASSVMGTPSGTAHVARGRAVQKLFIAMRDEIDFERALLRGRYLAAVAEIEQRGVPVDRPLLQRLIRHWPSIQRKAAGTQMNPYRIQTDGRLQQQQTLAWSLRKLKPRDLAVGPDGRNRVALRPFHSRTGRNQPNANTFVLGSSVWLRGLVRPAAGMGLALIDWSQQEFGIAAACSGDPNMKVAYSSGDPYLAFAQQSGFLGASATDEERAIQRKIAKTSLLAIQNGIRPGALAAMLGVSQAKAAELIRRHEWTYPAYWRWSDAMVDRARLNREMSTVFGWKVRVTAGTSTNFIRNFPIQANAAEMLRLACCEAVEAGISVCAPIHDALLIEAPLDALDDAVSRTQSIMRNASEVVLNGFSLRSSVRTIRHPDRYEDKRGEEIWNLVLDMLRTVEKEEGNSQDLHICDQGDVHGRPPVQSNKESKNKGGP